MIRVKQTLWAIMAAIILVVAIAFFAIADNTDPLVTKYGDVNLDNVVDSADAYIAYQYCSGMIELSDVALANADVNRSGNISIVDSILILEYLVGNISDLPYINDAEYSELAFENITFPRDNIRINYGEPYSLRGVVTSDKPILSVRVAIIDTQTGVYEADAVVSFTSSANVKKYDIRNSDPSLDNMIRFARLTPGEKSISLYCTNTQIQNVLLFAGRFKVGFSLSEISGHVYNKADSTDAREEQVVFDILNALDLTTDGGKIIDAAISYLGSDYSDMDCSKFTQASYSRALHIDLPRTSANQAEYCADNGYLIDFESLASGDLLFWRDKSCDCGRYHEIHHAGMYLGYAEGKHYLIESSSGIGGVIIRGLWGVNGTVWQLDCFGRPH